MMMDHIHLERAGDVQRIGSLAGATNNVTVVRPTYHLFINP